jgi:glucosamine-6-phosphate deaminase
MKVTQLAGRSEVAAAAADRLAALSTSQPDAVIALPTGSTPIPFYDELARRHGAGAITLSGMSSFNLDELVIPPSHPSSFRSFMELHVWGRTGFDRSRSRIPNPVAADLAEECARYDESIQAVGGFDLAVLGIGADGHVAYNLPGMPIEETHIVSLPEDVAQAHGVPREARPLRALTVGLGCLRDARQIIIVATGSSKATAVGHLTQGFAKPQWPATYLADHPRLELLVDEEAGAGL